MSETKAAIFIPGETGEVSDGYHTFNELYEHRHALFIALSRTRLDLCWRSKLDSSGKGMEGWFLAGMCLPTGDISYHLPDRLWELLDEARTIDHAPKWDGHTSVDVIARLKALKSFNQAVGE